MCLSRELSLPPSPWQPPVQEKDPPNQSLASLPASWIGALVISYQKVPEWKRPEAGSPWGQARPVLPASVLSPSPPGSPGDWARPGPPGKMPSCVQVTLPAPSQAHVLLDDQRYQKSARRRPGRARRPVRPPAAGSSPPRPPARCGFVQHERQSPSVSCRRARPAACRLGKGGGAELREVTTGSQRGTLAPSSPSGLRRVSQPLQVPRGRRWAGPGCRASREQSSCSWGRGSAENHAWRAVVSPQCTLPCHRQQSGTALCRKPHGSRPQRRGASEPPLKLLACVSPRGAGWKGTLTRTAVPRAAPRPQRESRGPQAALV